MDGAAPVLVWFDDRVQDVFGLKWIDLTMHADNSIQSVIIALNARKPPTKIWQQPYEHTGAAYKRLCALDGSDPKGEDLYDYTQDIIYAQGPIQEDLFMYLLPICLAAWKRSIFCERPNDYSALEDTLFPSLIRDRTLYKLLNDNEIRSVENYFTEAILELIGKEKSLHHSGSGNPVYKWFGAVCAFSILFPGLAKLWQAWWQMSNDGYAVASLQYISCLMYESDENPIFSAWTKTEGGGPPTLNEPLCNLTDGGWREENIEFLKEQLSLDYLRNSLALATERLNQQPVYREPCDKLSSDWTSREYLVEHRLEQLPGMLADISIHDWPAG